MSRRVAAVGDLVRYKCRIGDKTVRGIGRITEGSPDTNAEGSPLARDEDPVNCGPCGTGYIKATSENRCNGRKIARIQDKVRLPTGEGEIITATMQVKST